MHGIELTSSRPLVVVDFIWIREIKDFFERPPRTSEPLTVTFSSEGPSSELLSEPLSEPTPSVFNEDLIIETKPVLTPTKFRANIAVSDPLFKLILVGKTAPVTIALGLSTLTVAIGEDQVGTVNLQEVFLSVDDRSLITPFSLGLVLKLIPALEIDLKIENIQISGEHRDYQVVNETAGYITSLFARSPSPKTPVTKTEGPLIHVTVNSFGLDLRKDGETFLGTVISGIRFNMARTGKMTISITSFVATDIAKINGALNVILDGNEISVNCSKGSLAIPQDLLIRLQSLYTFPEKILDYEKPEPSKVQTDEAEEETVPVKTDNGRVIRVDCKPMDIVIGDLGTFKFTEMSLIMEFRPDGSIYTVALKRPD
jgi:hypothetical protein